MALPNLPVQGQNPWYEDRQNWDEAVELSIGGLPGRFAPLPGASKNALTGWFHVDGFGAVGDGVADDTAAIQNAINASRSNTVAGISGGTIYFPPGEYLITDSLILSKFAGTLVGNGNGNSPAYSTTRGNASVIRWGGPATKPMLFLRDYKHVLISNLRLEGNDANPPTYAIESNWTTGDGAGTGAQLTVERVHIGLYTWSSQGLNKGAVKNGIGFTGDNGNNDQFALRDVSFSKCEIGVYIPNSQSIWGIVDNVVFGNCTVAGIKSAAGFEGINLSFDLCAVDVDCNSTANIVITGWNSERASKILNVTNLGRVTVYGGKWTLMSQMTSTTRYVEAPLVTAGSGTHLYDVDIVSQVTPHPKIYIRGNGGGGVNGGTFRMVGCKTSMTMNDFDIASVATNALTVIIETANISVRRLFSTTSTSLSSSDNRPALSADAADLPTAITLVNDLKAKLIRSGAFS